MPHTRRYIFNTFTAFSLLLMPAVVCLWVDSYEYVTRIKIPVLHVLEFGSSYGHLSFHKPRISDNPLFRAYEEHLEFSRVPESEFGFYDQTLNWSFLGFAKESTIFGTSVYLIPHWFLVLFFAILPTIWLIKWPKRRKLLAMVGKCTSCGYDLTGNEMGMCPECGVELAHG